MLSTRMPLTGRWPKSQIRVCGRNLQVLIAIYTISVFEYIVVHMPTFLCAFISVLLTSVVYFPRDFQPIMKLLNYFHFYLFKKFCACSNSII